MHLPNQRAAPSLTSGQAKRSAGITIAWSSSLGSLAQRLSDYLVEWPRLSLEQQNRKLIMALAERVQALERGAVDG
jgi:hypothetical protein